MVRLSHELLRDSMSTFTNVRHSTGKIFLTDDCRVRRHQNARKR